MSLGKLQLKKDILFAINMVLFSNKANHDLDDIYEGLLNWKKIQLERNAIINYVVDIVDVCATIDKTIFHANIEYPEHKEFDEKVYKYTRYSNTTWYIIYDFDKSSNTVYIQHITPNHFTSIVHPNE